MSSSRTISFPPFHLDGSGQLRYGDEERFLRPKTLAVLHYLVQHAGQLVSKDELLAAVWPEVTVSEAVLTVCINELRQALGDEAQQPRFIATVHRRGYRFIAPLSTTPPVVSSQQSVVSSDTAETTPQLLVTENWPLTTPFVGREAELGQLQQWWELALSGQRQVVFVAGEPGIGKTTLVEAFLRGIGNWELGSGASPPQSPKPKAQSPKPGVWLGWGQCVEQYGEGEAYLPILEALARLYRGPQGLQVREVLHRYAPTWLLQMPGLVETAELNALHARTAGATRERMLREIAEALEALTSERGLMVVCEDLHVSDRSTLDLIAYVARRRGPAQLLVLGTYRPAEVVVRSHPLKGIVQELQSHQQCHHLPVELLTEQAVGDYLTARFAPQPVRPAFIAQVYERTEGNGLFLVTLVEYLLRQGLLRQVDEQWQWPGSLQGVGVPESVRQLIERQIEQLSEDEQRALEVAGVVGMEFSAAAVSAGLEIELLQGEEWCEGIARHTPLLQATGVEEWPDGTVATRYRFRHAVHQEVVYERLTASRQRVLHQRLGERLEVAYGQEAGHIATALAVYFERGRDYQRAVHYRQQAGENALRRSAHQEAISHLTRGLDLLKSLPDTPERSQKELKLQMTLGPVLIATAGYAAPAVANAYTRARELCEQVGETALLFRAVFGLWAFCIVRAEHRTALALAKQLLDLAESQQDTALPVEAYWALGASSLVMGEISASRAHFDQSIALYDPHQHRSLAFLYGYDPGMSCRTVGAWALWILGYPEQALERSRDAITFAQELSHPFSLAYAIDHAARLHRFRREPLAIQERTQAAIALSTEQGFPFYLAQGAVFLGTVLVEQGRGQEGIEQIQRGIAAFRATGAELYRPYSLGLLAEAYGQVAQAGEGLALLAEALAVVERTNERFYEAELYRLKGELTLQQFQVSGSKFQVKQSPKSKVQDPRSSKAKSQILNPNSHAEAEAEVCFHKAIEVARHQQAKSLELRAVMSLVRLCQHQAMQYESPNTQHVTRVKLTEAHRMLSEVYNWFTEGFDTVDLREAKVLLEELSDDR